MMKTNLAKVTAIASLLLGLSLLSACAQEEKGQQKAGGQEESPQERQQPASSANRLGSMTRATDSLNASWLNDFKADRYPGGAFAITDFGTPPSGDAVTVIKSLEPLAAAGDSKASYGIYLKLNVCLDRLKEAKARRGTGSDAQGLKECEGLTPENYSRGAEWLSLAAEQGSLPAQLVYASNGEAVLGSAADLIRNPDAIKEYKEKSFQYLRRAAGRGSVDALVSIGNSYLDGIMLDADPVAGYAYFQVVNSIDPSLVSRRKLNYLESQLSSSQLMEARRIQSEVSNECCSAKSP